ncbi:hypothetical protein DFH09DRAFT_1096018 [Mycena vulgaris]|nr:hypothetical protein DFH09DRAFT_1096018 [Mycena vulgaris]
MFVPPNEACSPSPQKPAKGSQLFKFKPSPQSKSDWLAGWLTTVKVIAAGAECIPFWYVKGVFGMVLVILETVEKVKRNRDDLKELLCGRSSSPTQKLFQQTSTVPKMTTTIPKAPLTYGNGRHSAPAAITFAVLVCEEVSWMLHWGWTWWTWWTWWEEQREAHAVMLSSDQRSTLF